MDVSIIKQRIGDEIIKSISIDDIVSNMVIAKNERCPNCGVVSHTYSEPYEIRELHLGDDVQYIWKKYKFKCLNCNAVWDTQFFPTGFDNDGELNRSIHNAIGDADTVIIKQYVDEAIELKRSIFSRDIDRAKHAISLLKYFRTLNG